MSFWSSTSVPMRMALRPAVWSASVLDCDRRRLLIRGGRGAVPPRLSPVLKLVALVLARADGPMRAREVHLVAEALAGTPLRWASVRQALSAGVRGESPRFRRVRHGVYRTAPCEGSDQVPF